MAMLKRLWLIARELGVVVFATRVPTLVVAMVFLLLAITEPAQDMLAEAVLDLFADVPTNLGGHRFGRALTIPLSLIALAASAWYWSRVALLYHRSMSDLPDNDEGRFRSQWRPAVVLWWPRLVGTAVFVGCALGLFGAVEQYVTLKADDGLLRALLGECLWLLLAMAMVLALGGLFLWLLIMRRRLIPGLRVSADPWALNGAVDPRAPLRRIAAIRMPQTVAPGWQRLGNIMLVASLVATILSLLWAGFWPVAMGDFFGGLAIALWAAAVGIPWFTFLTVASATNRLPYFGLAAVLVLAVPTINGWLFHRIDNHDVRRIEGSAALPARPRIDDVFDAWLEERRAAAETAYSSACLGDPRKAEQTGLCRSEEERRACKAPECVLWQEQPPFIVVAAEGGASRAGYWTALAVGEMLRQDPKLRDSIFALSSVSGGTLGAVLVRALIDVDRIQEKHGLKDGQRVLCNSGEPEPQPYLSCMRVFMRRDFLASAFAGMFYTDLLQRLIPSGVVALPDRARTLERSWERSWDDVVENLMPLPGSEPDKVRQEVKNIFGKGFLATWGRRIVKKDGRAVVADANDPIKPWPVLLLNGTSVETGRRVLTTNVDALTSFREPTSRTGGMDEAYLPCVAALTRYGKDAKLIEQLDRCNLWEAPAVEDPFTTLAADMPVSTAANMSARFPLVEPAGGITSPVSGKRLYHVVDGGIYENFGAQTIGDLLRRYLLIKVRAEDDAAAAKDPSRQWYGKPKVRPIVVLVSTDHELDGVRQVAAAYRGEDDRVGGQTTGARNKVVERKLRLGCGAAAGAGKGVPLCDARLMKGANEVLGDVAALYNTRSGRGESNILGIREALATAQFYDENFFHFRQCMNGTLRPASMTWYVSGISRSFMSLLLPSAHPAYSHKAEDLALRMSFAAWMKGAKTLADSQAGGVLDPCMNHAELKRLLDRTDRIRKGER